ncbi:MAG: hypothetical protein PWQ15_537 [Methanobacterium sp.]|jgi:LmbE family N-acetylglucosaminyl deacetylase|nr:hypothetical protein [Methanobacterium sp.]CDG64866.1 hypothetical protein MBMB1_0762 [Methanobacterium sp. MB1]
MNYKIILGLILVVSLVVMSYSYSNLPFYPPDYPAGPSLGDGDRLLVIAPHPDDEVICNGGVIIHAVENHIPVKVVVITDGNDTRTSPLVRHNESINGTRVLGLNEDDIIFMGYKDGSLNQLLNHHWNYNNPYTAQDGTTTTNYPYAFQENATYCGSNLADNLKTVINNFKPTIILYPSGDDEQRDHQATSGFVEYVTTQTEYTGSKYTYLLHLPPDWPSARDYYPEYYLNPPLQQVGLLNGPEWFVFNLTSYQEELKETAMLKYKTQIYPTSYLMSFVRKNELFAHYPTLNLSQSNLIIPKGEYRDGSREPMPLFSDPCGDGKYQGKEESLDITTVGMDLNMDKAWLSIKTVSEPSPNGIYYVHLNLFHSTEVKRVMITVDKEKAKIQLEMDGESLKESIPLTIHNNTFLLELPSSLFTPHSYFTVNVDSTRFGAIYDQTAWRVVKIS